MSKTNGKCNGKKNGKPATQGESGDSDRLPNGRFPPGVSGNPRGLQAQFAARFRRQLHEFAAQQVSEEDTRSNCQALIEDTFERAAKGDGQCKKILWDRLMPATLQVDANVTGMTSTQALDIFDCMAADYVKAGRLPDLTDRG